MAGTVPEHKTLTVTANTRMHTSLCLSKIWDDLSSDSERDQYREAVNGYFKWVENNSSSSAFSLFGVVTSNFQTPFLCFFYLDFMSFLITSIHLSFGVPIFRYPPIYISGFHMTTILLLSAWDNGG